MTFERKVSTTIKRYDMLHWNDRVLVGVSGGPDSVALLYFLWSLKDEYNLDLQVAHLNHRLRGKESEEDAKFVQELSRELGLPITLESLDIRALKKEKKLTTQQAAREGRYEFFERVAKETKADKIALGHNADDQFETVIMGLLRGGGLEALCGIPPVRGKFIRPLIEVSRKEIEEYCCENNLRFRVDKSNLEKDYFRNKIRLELLPALEKYTPKVKNRVLQLAELLQGDLEYLSEQIGEIFAEVASREEDKVVIDIKKLLSYPKGLIRRIIREALRIIVVDISDFGFRHIEGVIKLAEGGSPSGVLNLPKGILVKRKYGQLILGLRGSLDILPALKSVYELPVPGKTFVEELKITVETDLMDKTASSQLKFDNSHEAYLDYNKVKGKVILRPWEAGDKFVPLGMKAPKKLHDLFVDLKVPKEERKMVPIICDEEKIVWVGGYQIDERVKIDEKTKKILKLVLTG